MSNIDDFYKNINKIQSSISYQAILEFQNRITQMYQPIFDMTSEIQNQHNAITAPIQKMVEQMSSSFLLPYRESLARGNYQQQILAIQSSLNSFASTIASMDIHPTYVYVPESLIPEDFTYEEIADDSTDPSNKANEITTPVKRLSFSDTLAIIGLLLEVLFFTISFIQTNQDSLQDQKNHDERIAVEVESNRIQEEQNQILQSQVVALEKQAEYLLAIYNKIEEAGSASPESDSTFLGTDLTPLNSASPSQCTDSYQTVEADEPDDSDTPHKAD